MYWLIASLSVGILSVAYLPRLLSVSELLVLLVAGAITTLTVGILKRASTFTCGCTMLLILGFCGGNLVNQQSVDGQLPKSMDREVVQLRGYIVDVVQRTPKYTQILFKPDSDRLARFNITTHSKLLLNYYGSELDLQPGDSWAITAALKTPRGFVNPAGFDYHGWLLRKGIAARGVIKEASPLSDSASDKTLKGLVLSAAGAAREGVRQQLARSEISHESILKALIVGDKSAITQKQWQLLQSTGTVHLIAISGLHIGIVSILIFTLCYPLGKLLNLILSRLNAISIAHICAALGATGYTALAGFSTPTLRALIMVLAVQLCLQSYRPVSKRLAMSFALLGVAVADPLAVWDAGFWLSFGAAVVLLVLYSGRCAVTNTKFKRARQGLYELMRCQWYLFFLLLVPLLMLVKQATLLAPLANVVAIPLLSIAIAPLLLGFVCFYVLLGSDSVLAEWCLRLADKSAGLLLDYLHLLTQSLQAAPIISSEYSLVAIFVSIVSMGLILMPRGFPGRGLGYIGIVLPVLIRPPAAQDELRVTFLDVGQGSAIVIESSGRTAVYDTGRRYSAKFEAGTGVISPYLYSRGLVQIEHLIISHSDADHSGGAAGLSSRHPINQLTAPKEFAECVLSQTLGCLPKSWNSPANNELIKAASIQSCEQTSMWRWGASTFTLFSARGMASLQTGSAPKLNKRNNRSCLLLIEHLGVKVLLTGDIERDAEKALLGHLSLPREVDWMSAPHHGSKTSSSAVFLAHTIPKNTVFQAGYNNHYHHPNDHVMKRYADRNTYRTDQQGAIQVRVSADGKTNVIRWRQDYRRFWY